MKRVEGEEIFSENFEIGKNEIVSKGQMVSMIFLLVWWDEKWMLVRDKMRIGVMNYQYENRYANTLY